MELRVVLLLELIGFVNIMKVEFNRKREFKDDFMVFDMNNWIAQRFFIEMWKLGEEYGIGQIQSFVVDRIIWRRS